MMHITARRIGLAAILVAGAAIIAAGLLQVSGVVLSGGWLIALLAAAAAALWLADYARAQHRLASPMLVAFVVLAAVSAGLPGGRALAPLAVVAALAAWDLDRFAARMDAVAATDEAQRAERRRLEVQHLYRLAVVAVLGLALAWLAEAIRVELSFGWAIVLGLLAALGLAALVRALVRESD